jgi:hypothetical protein
MAPLRADFGGLQCLTDRRQLGLERVVEVPGVLGSLPHLPPLSDVLGGLGVGHVVRHLRGDRSVGEGLTT